MRRRTNPWPAFVDLFTALFIAAFAGLIIFSAIRAREGQVELERVQVRAKVDSVANLVRDFLQNAQRDFRVYKCEDDICIDLYIHFEKDKDLIVDPEELKNLHTIGEVLKNALDNLLNQDKRDIIIVIEGHTDSRQVYRIEDHRLRTLFNWNLSSQRATSVLYEFQTLGLSTPTYQIIAIGYADSRPICLDQTEECFARNRRTTLRLRVDTKRIEDRLSINPMVTTPR